MRRFAAGLLSTIGIVLIVAVMAICIPLTVPRVMGYEVYHITSGSMEPAIGTGSLAYAKEAAPEEIEEGDVIVFYGGQGADTVITHRVVENDEENREFVTKGDANAANDPLPIPYAHLLGRVTRTVPMLGFFLPAVSTMQGKLSLLGVLGAAVLFRILAGMLRSGVKEK